MNLHKSSASILATLALPLLLVGIYSTVALGRAHGSKLADFCVPANQRKEIVDLWSDSAVTLNGIADTAGQNATSLYYLQTYTNNVLRYSFKAREKLLTDKILTLYIRALQSLSSTSEYAFRYYPQPNVRISETELSDQFSIWLSNPHPDGRRVENLVSSAQFIYVISASLRYIAELDSEDRTAVMLKFGDLYTAVLSSHLQRWVIGLETKSGENVGPFQRRGWGCKHPNGEKQSGLTHTELINALTSNELRSEVNNSLCNAITDTDIWIIASVANFLMSSNESKKRGGKKLLSEDVDNKLSEYVKNGATLLGSRTSFTTEKNFAGKTTTVANFDLGVWDTAPTYNYSCVTSEQSIPIIEDVGAAPCPSVTNTAWDIGHASRFVHAFETLYDSAERLGLSFPDVTTMQRFSNAFAYSVFDGDFETPLFNNFMNGANGWFRVGYSRQEGFGIGPYDLSSTALTGGYAIWSKYNSDIDRIYSSVFDMLASKNPSTIKHLNKYYNETHWKNYKPVKQYDFVNGTDIATKLALLQFYPTVCGLDS